jgi:uncharacterized damage-inducible protein DinB
MLSHFKMFAAYNSWANARLYEAASLLSDTEYRTSTGAFFGSLHATLNHILVADRLWMKRFTGTGVAPSSLDAILYGEFETLAAARQNEDQRIIDWIDTLDEAKLTGYFTYVPVTNPNPVTQRLAPALAHFFNHQTHHRGQAHSTLTALGKPSLALDLIYFQRTDDGKAYA